MVVVGLTIIVCDCLSWRLRFDSQAEKCYLVCHSRHSQKQGGRSTNVSSDYKIDML